MNAQLPSALQAKDQAKRLRTKKAGGGTTIGHAKSLELVAHQHGFRDWNAMFGAIGNRPPKDWRPGDKVCGTYLSQPFTAKVIAVAILKPGWFRLELHLDEAVDVVTFESFSNLRTRVRGVVGPKGHSVERTSDGKPQLQIDMS
ncbi:MAG: hypothetical protein HRU33_26095 [Rhodobacteraceae bacterium]|nr:hypothetical protein [Paracoccaceae bacterium]